MRSANRNNQSRNSARNKSPLVNVSAVNANNMMAANLGNSLSSAKKITKFPSISNSQDESNTQNINPAANSGLIIGVCSQQGKRPYQEDDYSIRPYLTPTSPSFDQDGDIETHFFGLFDGHAGGRCSKHVAGSLANTLTEDPQYFSNLPQALRRSFHTTNEQFLKIAEKLKLHDGSTGICAILRDNKVLVANVGDCRALIISGGRPIQMSIDQKPTIPEEVKRINSLGGTVEMCMGVARVNRVLAVSRAFGNRTLRSVIRPDAELMQREITREDEYLIMASDGLWDVLKNKDVADICNNMHGGGAHGNGMGNPQAIADELVQTALARGSMDNVTCICVRLTNFVLRTLAAREMAALNNVNNSRELTSQQRLEKVLQTTTGTQVTNSTATNTPSTNSSGNGNATNNDGGGFTATRPHSMSEGYSNGTNNTAAAELHSKSINITQSATNGKYFPIEDSPLTTGKKHLHQQMSINNSNISNQSSGNYNATNNNGSRIPVINSFGANNNNNGAKNENNGSFSTSSPISTPPLLQGRAQSPKIRGNSVSIFGSPVNNNGFPDSGTGTGTGNTANNSSGNNLNGYANMNGLGNISSQGGPSQQNALFKSVSFKRHEASFQQEDGMKGEGIYGSGSNNSSLTGSFFASHPKNASSNSDSFNAIKSYAIVDNDGSMAVASSPSTNTTHSISNSIIANNNLYANRPATSGSINLKSNNDFLSMSSNAPLTSSLPSAAINHLASTFNNGTPSLFKSHYSQQHPYHSNNHHNSNGLNGGGHGTSNNNGNNLASSDYKQNSHNVTSSPSKIGYGWVDRVK